jgi:hypothetical protein
MSPYTHPELKLDVYVSDYVYRVCIPYEIRILLLTANVDIAHAFL